MEKISRTNHMRNGALHTVKQKRNTLRTIKSNVNLICQILPIKYHLKHVTEGNIEEGNDEKEHVRSYWMILQKRKNSEY
jgi:hypothetical protein